MRVMTQLTDAVLTQVESLNLTDSFEIISF